MIWRGLRILVLLLIMGMLSGVSQAAFAAPETQYGPNNAVLLTSIPGDYVKLEKLFTFIKDGGANTVIVGPLDGSVPDTELLPNVVYLAHQAELKIYVVLSSRNLPEALEQNPDWEDMRYDLTSGTLQGTGRLDLFNSEASDYVVKKMKEIASYWIDGIILGSDFYYGSTEGMSNAAMDEFKNRYSMALVPGRAIARVGWKDDGSPVLEYGEGFSEWADMKKGRLVGVLQNIMMAARSVNSDIKFGVPLHGPELENPGDALATYAFDLNAFNAQTPDFYWLLIAHRDLRESRRLTYKKSMEELTRIAQDATTMVKEPCRVLIVVQTTMKSGRILPLSEIEEASAAVKKSGNYCIAYQLKQEGLLPLALTKKIFRK